MAVENNLIDVEALGEAKSIDFANKMGERLNKLFEGWFSIKTISL